MVRGDRGRAEGSGDFATKHLHSCQSGIGFIGVDECNITFKGSQTGCHDNRI